MADRRGLRDLSRVTSEAQRIHALLPLCTPTEGVQEINLDYAATTPALQVAVDAVTEFIP